MIESARGAIHFVTHNRNKIAEIQYTDTSTMVHIIIVGTTGSCLVEGLLGPVEFIRLRTEAEVDFVRIVP